MTAARGLCRAWLLLALVCSACSPAAPVCRFGAEHAVFEAQALGFDDLTLLSFERRELALFSAATGSYARILDSAGNPHGEAVRLGERCEAGLAAAVSGKRALLACARRGRIDGPLGRVVLYALDAQLALTTVREVGEVGPNSHGVALIAHGDTLALAFQDQTLADARIWFTPDAERLPAELVSDPDWDASGPGLAAQGGKLYVYWAETRTQGRGDESRVQMRAWQPGAQAVTLAVGKDPLPSPSLVAFGNGLWLAHRDSHRAGRKPGLFVVALDAQGSPRGPAVRLARADGVGRPTLRSCLGGLLAATPRTFAGDYLIGVVRADRALEAISGEQQFYEDSHEFAQVAASCSGASALLLIAERGRLGSERAGLRAVTFACESG